VLDSVTVRGKAGLSKEDFINEMMKDTNFYQAFRNMHKYSFTAYNQIYTFDKKNRKTASIFRKVYHNNDGATYKSEILAEKDSGDVYDRKGEFDQFTVKMFDYIFMNPGSSDFVQESETENKSESYKDKLKTLIFSPGKPVEGVPLVSNKTQLFSDKYRKFYNYYYHHSTLQDTLPVYRFNCKIKDGIKPSKEDNLMIKELTTYFDKSYFIILGRYIDMAYQSTLFDFDVKMYIELGKFGDDYLPVKIRYEGYWDIPMKKPEKCAFYITHTGYKKVK
jgi:hypothetical protein